jgi:hypothetical protein
MRHHSLKGLLMKYFCILLALLVLAVPAGAGETVKTPNVARGQLELEQKGKYQMDVAAARNHAKELEFNVGYGVTHHWKTKAELTLDNDKAGDMTYRRVKFENIYQLTKSKDGYMFDSAVYNDISFSDRSDSSHDVTFGVLAAKNIGQINNVANMLVRRDFGDTAAHGTNFIYRWQSRYTVSPELQPGFEILGDTKKRDAFRDQSLGIGPAIFGSFGFDTLGWGDTSQKIGYELAYIVGVTPATPDGTLKWKLKYGIQF